MNLQMNFQSSGPQNSIVDQIDTICGTNYKDIIKFFEAIDTG